MADLNSSQNKILSFRNERDWAQFHDPKTLDKVLSNESTEPLDNFLWKSPEQSRNLSLIENKNLQLILAMDHKEVSHVENYSIKK